eukprot:6202958-Pleurochrysis_carterae.AAC.2
MQSRGKDQNLTCTGGEQEQEVRQEIHTVRQDEPGSRYSRLEWSRLSRAKGQDAADMLRPCLRSVVSCPEPNENQGKAARNGERQSRHLSFEELVERHALRH